MPLTCNNVPVAVRRATTRRAWTADRPAAKGHQRDYLPDLHAQLERQHARDGAGLRQAEILQAGGQAKTVHQAQSQHHRGEPRPVLGPATINEISAIQQVIATAVEEQSASTDEIGNRVSRAADRTTDIAQRVTAVTSTSHAATESATRTEQAASALAATAGELQTVVAEFQLAGRGRPADAR
jgi:hypothetical protein